ncbi:dentin sialophosphoprotein precursor [Strigomonas culicis]|uniref:Dentin sialophosphoprotein n=1 Tax=Strigomonas culicis TaxID=28005 RepID=S9TJZ7_9TRYP|nr:dentin sialophosphoprotein precursor [Strigomonas culicis]|eukprot:EPY18482.1 dentin sialophosphoprotein precursor [Strigomonas culicis]
MSDTSMDDLNTTQPTVSTAGRRRSYEHVQEKCIENDSSGVDHCGGDAGGEAANRRQRRQRKSVRDLQKLISEQILSESATTNGTYSINGENNSFTPPSGAPDAIDAAHSTTLFNKSLTNYMNSITCDVEVCANSLTSCMPHSPTPPSVDTAAVSAPDSEDNEAAEEEKKSSPAEQKTTGSTDSYPLDPPLPMSSVETRESQCTISNAEISSQTSAQGVRGKTDKRRSTLSSDGGDVDKKKERKLWRNMKDLHRNVGDQIRSMLPSRKTTSSTVDTTSSAGVNLGDGESKQLSSTPDNQNVDPTENSVLSEPKLRNDTNEMEGDMSLGGGLLISSITRAPTSSSAKADTELEDARPASPLRRDAKAQLAKWRRSVSLENNVRRSINDNSSLEGSHTSSIPSDDTVDVRASLQSWRGDEYPAAGRVPRKVKILCADDDCMK